jgi:hypothetical protein
MSYCFLLCQQIHDFKYDETYRIGILNFQSILSYFFYSDFRQINKIEPDHSRQNDKNKSHQFLKRLPH